MTVEEMPKASDMAKGRNIVVATVGVDIKGINPTKVVTEVKIIGLKRLLAACEMASVTVSPLS